MKSDKRLSGGVRYCSPDVSVLNLCVEGLLCGSDGNSIADLDYVYDENEKE